ncbi:hypothetical protein E4U13_002392 [Claviceps humidiphila]|uniref:Uncharacterized protein n=1 Tax=Claviceps humidiphila TaxID=1294629 RepID=A0A9P7Q228_9HYPO|nr:hypothetical protein E4U13_002392 [Claviceps humidiphila]
MLCLSAVRTWKLGDLKESSVKICENRILARKASPTPLHTTENTPKETTKNAARQFCAPANQNEQKGQRRTYRSAHSSRLQAAGPSSPKSHTLTSPPPYGIHPV